MTVEQVEVDPAQLRQKTEFSLRLLQTQQRLPARAPIVYWFEAASPVSQQNIDNLKKAAEAAGYEAFARNSRDLAIRTKPIPMNAKSISDRWIVLSQLVAPYGYQPDNWGF